MNPLTLNPFSLHFKLKSPVLADPSSIQNRCSVSGPFGHPSPVSTSPQFYLSLSSCDGFAVAPPLPHQFSPSSASFPHSLGTNLIDTVKPLMEKKLPSNGLIPGGFRAAPQAAHVGVTIHHPVHEDAASTHTSSDTSKLNGTLEQQLLNCQIEMSNKIMGIEENNLSLFNRLVDVKKKTDKKIDKMGASLATIVQPLVGRIEEMELRGAEMERLYAQILSSDREEIKTIEDEIKFLEEQQKVEEEEKCLAPEKKGLKYLGFGGIVLAGIGAAYLYSKN